MKRRLTIEDRILIDQLLKLNYKLKDISNILKCESSTISREIKKKELQVKVYIKNVKNKKIPLCLPMKKYLQNSF